MNTFYKYAVQPLAPEWRNATLIYSWLNFLENILTGYPFKPLAYNRYIGDIFTTYVLMNTYSKNAVQPWAPEWRNATLIFSWLNLKKTY